VLHEPSAGGFHGPLHLWFSTSAENQPALEAVANMLRTNLGITDIRFNVLDFSQFLSLVKARKVTGPFFSSWLMDYPSPHTYIAPLYTAGARTNRTGYANPLVDQHIAEGDRAPSVAAAAKFVALVPSAVWTRNAPSMSLTSVMKKKTVDSDVRSCSLVMSFESSQLLPPGVVS